jgi:flagellin
MSISFQTNYAALVAQNNLNMNNTAQTSTIEALTSGYRINSSGDDPAGLAVANQFRDSVTQLTQGVINANSGVSTLQIIDGGLNNISTILDRMQTLATESASTTFSGDRSNIQVEYQQLVGEITQQATNVGLNSGGAYNVNNSVFVGGGTTNTNSQVDINLGGVQNAVDATSLKLDNTSVIGGGTELTGGTPNAIRLDAPGATFLNSSTDSEAFNFNLVVDGAATTFTATVTGQTGGLTEAGVLSQLNGALNTYGINAQVGSDGQLQFGGATPFTVAAATTSTSPIATAGAQATNLGTYNLQGSDGNFTTGTDATAETLTFQNGQGTANVSLLGTESLGGAIAAINAQTAKLGIYAVQDAAGTGISFQSASNFTASSSVSAATTTGVFGTGGAQAAPAAPSTTSSVTGNALAAVTAIQNAISQLGNTQAAVGAGENKLQYAIDLANSQITNLSSSESDLRDADIATEAANLSKEQVLEQSSVAAMAQANSTPQAILKLLQQ